MQLSNINWPAIITREGDDELTYVATEQVWLNDPGLNAEVYMPGDKLIDSTGKLYLLENKENGVIQPVYSKQVISVDSLIGFVKKHAATTNICCIDKIGFRDFKEGMAIVASLADD
jgi:hypothetical protein